MDPNFSSNFKAAGEQLMDFFTHSLIKASFVKEAPATEHLIDHCKNLSDLHNRVLLSQGTSSDYVAKLKINGGRAFSNFVYQQLIKILKEIEHWHHQLRKGF